MVLFIIGIGLAVYLYGTAVCKGALLGNMDKKQISLSLGISALWQIVVLTLGNLTAIELHAMNITKSEYPVNAFACLMIFGIIALRMLINAIKNEPVEEKRAETKGFYKLVFGICLSLGFYTFLTGFALGLLQIPLLQELLFLVGLSVVAVFGGLYAGYRLGYGQRNTAYICGGICLFAGDILLFFQYFMS